MYKKFDYDNPTGYFSWNHTPTPNAYFIEIPVTEESYKELIFYYKNQHGMGIKESLDYIRLHMNSSLKYDYAYMDEWKEKLEELSLSFSPKVMFRAYCNDMFVGVKGTVTAGYAGSSEIVIG